MKQMHDCGHWNGELNFLEKKQSFLNKNRNDERDQNEANQKFSQEEKMDNPVNSSG